MKKQLLLLLLLIALGCSNQNSQNIDNSINIPFYVGTYTDGESQGIYKYELEEDGNLKKNGLAAISENPSYLTKSKDGNFMLVVNEIDNDNKGGIESFAISEDSLTFLSRSLSGGAHPCFVSTNKDGFVLTANYTGGNVGLLKIDQKGKLSDLLDLQVHTGNGGTERQTAPHAHYACFMPNANLITAVDLGTNQLWFSVLDQENQKLIPSDPNTLTLNPGAGPRHLAIHPSGNWIYIVNELNSTIAMVEQGENHQYNYKFEVSTLPSDYSEANFPADIKISADGQFLYATNRGHNSIVIFKIVNDGGLELLGHESTKGDWPRNFSFSPDEKYLLVANQKSNNIVSFARDEVTGLLKRVGEIEAATPVCILF